ncbi:hypothetical protein GCM10027570_34380 [Streptomonospora sediminis]
MPMTSAVAFVMRSSEPLLCALAKEGGGVLSDGEAVVEGGTAAAEVEVDTTKAKLPNRDDIAEEREICFSMW